MFVDHSRQAVWDQIRHRDFRPFAPFVTREVIEQAALRAGVALGAGPLCLFVLVWLAIACALHPSRSFATVLTLALKLMRNDPAWASVKAVRDGRVHLSPRMPFGWVDFPPSVNRLIGLRWLAKILYPDKVSDDMRAQTREFYAMFYHRTPSAGNANVLVTERGVSFGYNTLVSDMRALPIMAGFGAPVVV